MFMNMEELAMFASENRDMFSGKPVETDSTLSLEDFIRTNHITDEACREWMQMADKPECVHLKNGVGFEVFLNIYARFHYHLYLCQEAENE